MVKTLKLTSHADKSTRQFGLKCHVITEWRWRNRPKIISKRFHRGYCKSVVILCRPPGTLDCVVNVVKEQCGEEIANTMRELGSKIFSVMECLQRAGQESCLNKNNTQICINILSRYRTSYSRRIISCSHG